MVTTLTALEVFKQVEECARRNALRKCVRDGRCMKPGAEGGRQGDIYVYRVADDWPRGKRLESRQLTVGDTQGARHFAAGDVEVYEGVKAPAFIKFKDEDGRELSPLLGPCLIVKGQDFVGEHPEHDHYVLSPGPYQVVHQMDARSLSRVQD